MKTDLNDLSLQSERDELAREIFTRNFINVRGYSETEASVEYIAKFSFWLASIFMNVRSDIHNDERV